MPFDCPSSCSLLVYCFFEDTLIELVLVICVEIRRLWLVLKTYTLTDLVPKYLGLNHQIVMGSLIDPPYFCDDNSNFVASFEDIEIRHRH